MSMLFNQRQEELRKMLKHQRVLDAVVVMLKVSVFFTTKIAFRVSIKAT